MSKKERSQAQKEASAHNWNKGQLITMRGALERMHKNDTRLRRNQRDTIKLIWSFVDGVIHDWNEGRKGI